MNNYDIGKGGGLCHLDTILNTPNSSGEPFSVVKALDETVRMALEVDGRINNEMFNVPSPVTESLKLLAMAVGCLAAIVRSRVVTEPTQESPHAAR